MTDYRKIVACTDLSPSADKAVKHAIRLARRVGAQVLVLHVMVSASQAGDEEPDGGVRRAIDEARALLQMQQAYGSASDVDIELEVRRGVETQEILTFVKERRADLVVVGARGAGTFVGEPAGGVVDRLVLNADVPVLVVPS
jgi:nucleotide-binding universal stress UspA family protein